MASDFLGTVKAFVDLANKGITKVPNAVMEEVTRRVKARTPIESGRLRNGWVLEGLTLKNDVPYAAVVEYGLYPKNPKTGNKTVNGFSTQAPAGMLGITLAELDQIVNEVEAKTK